MFSTSTQNRQHGGARRDGAALSKEYIRHLTIASALAVPALIAVFDLMDRRADWTMPGVWTMALVVVGMGDFVAAVGLEPFKRKLGDLTLPMLLLAPGMVLLFTLTYGINRFVADIGYGWLYPAVLVALCTFAVALFMERNTALKATLAVNAVALAMLWNLAYSDKLVLPF